MNIDVCGIFQCVASVRIFLKIICLVCRFDLIFIVNGYGITGAREMIFPLIFISKPCFICFCSKVEKTGEGRSSVKI